MKERVFTGRAWVLRDPEGKIYNNIDTDQIYHNNFLAITEISQMGQYALGNLKGYEQFAKQVKPGDIVVAGKNFGAGSSRQQAVDCFAALGVKIILCESIGAIYKRNAINSGFPIMACAEVTKLVSGDAPALRDGDTIEIDVVSGEIKKKDGSAARTIAKGEPFSGVQMDIYEAGNMFSCVPPAK